MLRTPRAQAIAPRISMSTSLGQAGLEDVVCSALGTDPGARGS